MALSCVLFEDNEIDHVVVVAEANKIKDWCIDYEMFTKITPTLYWGPAKKREKIRADLPQVIVTTYETAKADIAKPGRSKLAHWTPGPLTEALSGKRVLVVYDEVTKLRTRSSGLYQAQECLLRVLRKTGKARVLGLTATPIERNPENAYNIGRLIAPGVLGSVQDFEDDYVVRDMFGNPHFKNISDSDQNRTPGVQPLRQRFGSVLKIKSKNDPDVIDQFPRKVEEFDLVAMTPRQADFYHRVRDAFFEQEWTPGEQRQLFGVLRLIAGHPLALVRSQGKIAQALTEQVGVPGLMALGSGKQDALGRYLNTVVKGQGAKAIVFTFYGQTVLPVLHEFLRASGYEVVINHGQMTPTDRQRSIDAIRYGDAEIFLSSDAGSRGLNLPEATCVLNYELPVTFANYKQRSDRVHRIDSLAKIVTINSLIVLDSIEEVIGNMVLARNRYHDLLLGDEDEDGHWTDAERLQMASTVIGAADRRQMIERARERALSP